MLPEDRRKQLDGIVQQMISNKEPDSNIRFVVDDFKKKYSTVENPQAQTQKKGMLQGAGEFVAKDTLGIGPQDNSGGLLKNIYQSTLGSKGLAGIAQLPGKAVSAISEYGPGGQRQQESQYGLSENISKQAADLALRATKETDPAKKAKLKEQARVLTEEAQNLINSSKEIGNFTDTTGKQALGTSVNAATTAASFGALAPAKIAVGQGGAAFAKSASVALAKNATVGAGYSAGESLQGDDSWKNIAKESFIGGLTSGVAVTGLSTAGGLAKNAATNSAQALMDKALKISKLVIEKGKSPSKQLLDNGTWGTLGSMYKQVGQGIERAKAKIAPKLANTPGGLSEAEVRNGVFTALKKEVGDLYSDKQINQMVNQVPLNAFKKNGGKFLPWVDVNNIRSQLDRELGDRFWMSNANPTLAKRASEAATNFMRNAVKKSTGTAAEFAEEAKLITARKALHSALALAQKNYGIGFTDILFGLAGFSQGDSIGERATNAALLVGSEKIVRSSLLKSAGAQVLKKSVKVGSKVANSAVGKGFRTAIIKGISGATPQK